MCGRYTLIKLASFLKYFSWIEQPELFPQPQFNIAPSQNITVITGERQPGKIDFMRWGLVPSWSKDASVTAGSKMINARSETLASKPSFKHLVKYRRCLIPADGFYEWKQATEPQTKPAGKSPWYFYLADQRPFAFAGLYDSWHSPDGSELRTCTIITTHANPLLAPIHQRMPVILHDHHCRRWIENALLSDDEIHQMLSPYPADQMRSHPVSSQVNRPSNQGASLIEPFEPAPESPVHQPGLFDSHG